jgi:23S rRNA (uracil1939-C5)-methyltransferase
LPTTETFRIEKLVYGGEGLARLDGRVILVPYVLPDEVVTAEIAPVKKGLFRGRLIEATSPSPARIEPPCPYFQRCGGCHYQHIDYAHQVEQKRSILREVLRRVGKIEYEGDIAAITGEPWGYRNRVQLHVDQGALGYFELGSRRLCPIDHCAIASPALNQAISKLNTPLPYSGAVELFTSGSEVQVNFLDRAPRSVLSMFESIGTAGPIEYDGFRVGRNSFFQVNRFLIDRLIACATSDREGDSAVDLYAGVGLFTRRLADRFRKVTAVEAGPSAVRDLEHNLRGTGEIKHSSAEEFLADCKETPDFILADPPRAGLGKGAVADLGRIRAPRVTIVSCDPATLSRDLRGLLGAGYRIEKITVVDLFPQTFHIETVVDLELV